MKKISLGTAIAAMTIGGMAAPALAHHSAAMFDQSKTVTVTGNVKEFQYTNPHSWLQVLAAGKDGKATLWGFEAEGPSSLLRAGIKFSTFMPGDKVTVMAHPMKDGRPAGLLMNVTKADGKVYSPAAKKPGK